MDIQNIDSHATNLSIVAVEALPDDKLTKVLFFGSRSEFLVWIISISYRNTRYR